jgi:predicted hydrocarbon binding protein
MHGIIHLELEKFVVESYDRDVWNKLVDAAGIGDRLYTPVQAYPDEDLVRVVEAAVAMTKKPATEILEAFGEYLVPTYLSVYGLLLDPAWKTLDVVEHTEETIHRVVRMRQPGAAPPRLRVERKSPTEVVITYDSPRKLCAVARGIVRGVAKHFDESIAIAERACMHRGDAHCSIAVTRVR